jgi:hypothetical protein
MPADSIFNFVISLSIGVNFNDGRPKTFRPAGNRRVKFAHG